MKQELINEIHDACIKDAKRVLLGRRITDVRYMTKEEAEMFCWYSIPIVFELDNKILCFPSRDDEGNDGGSLFYDSEDFSGAIPTLSNV